MNCKQCSEVLVDYSRDELPPDSKAAIASHLSGCSSCSAELAGLLEMAALLDVAEQPSANMQENFQARLAAEMARTRSVAQNQPLRSGLFQTLWPSRPFAAMCYSFALLACGLVSGQLLPPSTLGLNNDYVLQGNTQGNNRQICSVSDPANNEVL